MDPIAPQKFSELKMLFDNNIHSTSKSKHLIKYFVAAILSLSLLLSCEIWISLSAVNASTAKYFQISSQICDWFSTVFFVTFVIQAIPSMFIPQLIGVKKCIVSGILLIFLGCVIRTISFLLGYFDNNRSYYINSAFWLCMFGNVFVSLSQCFLLNIPSLVSATFFEKSKQLICTTWIVNGSIIGTAIGFIFCPLVIGNVIEMSDLQSRFIIITTSEAAFSGFLLVAAIIIVPSNPPTMTNQTENQDEQRFKQRWHTVFHCIIKACKDMLKLLKSPLFIVLFVIYGLYYALSSTFYIILSNIITESLGENYSTLITYVGSLAVISGAIFSAFMSYILQVFPSMKALNYTSAIILLCNAIPLLIMFLLSYLNKQTRASIITLTISYGMVAAPYLAFGYDILSKVASPISENIPVTLALIFSNVFCVALTYGSMLIHSGYRNLIFLGIFSAIYILMGCVHFFFEN